MHKIFVITVYVSPVTLLEKVSVSVIYLQTSERLLRYLNEPTVLSIGYTFVFTRKLLIFWHLLNETIGLGVKTLLT